MLAKSNWLLIGAGMRNVGKTEFACRVIARTADTAGVPTSVYAVKVTTVQESGGGCPRGGKGCGVCSSLGDSHWLISEETCGEGDKDTQRMLKAGAAKVFWLRVKAAHLVEGMHALIQRLPADAPVVCESNSVRKVLRPGLFLLLGQKGRTKMKASAAAVEKYAHCPVAFDDNNWDVDPSRVVFHETWQLTYDAAAVVLAGGQSRRMGTDKSLLKWNGRPLIDQIARGLQSAFQEVWISTNETDKFRFLPYPLVSDVEMGKGPLMGIYSALKASRHELVFMTGCDIPAVDASLMAALHQYTNAYDVVVPVDHLGRVEPLLGFYKKSALPAIANALAAHQRRVVSFYDHVNVRHVPFCGEGWYHNVNTPEDFQRLRDVQKAEGL